MSELVIQSGKLQGKRLVLPSKQMVVGRDDDCDLRIGSALVSRKHCVLKNTPEGILVTDLGSQNGTLVNDAPIKGPTLLREGDVLRIGSTLLQVPVKPKAKQSVRKFEEKISETEIADWLADVGSHYSSADTAVLPSYTPPVPDGAPAMPADKPMTNSELQKKLSATDEAAEIIRKHWEAVKAKQKTK
ncbi:MULTISPECIES: FHA domain-containing protein [unclassified Schlesneria]|uniref:FHA domain-containing protein n=2 Tax=Planctomycetaceae TaxID=126 RepID=UPI0035A03BE8